MKVFMQSLKLCVAVMFITACFVLAACSDSSRTPSATSSSQMGSVALSIADAALDNFSSVEMEILWARLEGEGTTNPWIFNTNFQSSETTTLNLLSHQGLSALLGSVEIPAGSYTGLGFYYRNVTAKDTDGVDQVINVLDPQLSSISFDDGVDIPVYYFPRLRFPSPLVVSAGSNQSLSLDFDLSNSITAHPDDNTWNFALTVAAKPQQKAEPVECFPVRITDLLSDADVAVQQLVAVAGLSADTIKPLAEAGLGFDDGSFRLNAKILSDKTSDATESGDIQIELGSHPTGSMIAGADGTEFSTGHWLSALGAALKESGSEIIWGPGGEMEYICVTGSLLNGVVIASHIEEFRASVATATTATDVSLRGCIVATDDGAGTMTVAIDKSMGTITEIDYLEEVTFTINDDTVIKRGKTDLVIEDLTAYNYCDIVADENSGAFTATKISITPSFVAGDVTNVAEGAGAKNGDLISFTPSVVNLFRGTALDGLTSLPATLQFETFGKSIAAGDEIKVMAFFSPGSNGVSQLLKRKKYGGVAGLREINSDSGAELCVSYMYYSSSSSHEEGSFIVSGGNEVELSVIDFAELTQELIDALQLVRVGTDGSLTSMTLLEYASLTSSLGTLGDGSTPFVVCGYINDDGLIVAEILYALDSADMSLDADNTFSFDGETSTASTAVGTASVLDFAIDVDGTVYNVEATDATRVRVYNEKNIPTTLSLADAAELINSGAIENVQVVSTTDATVDADGDGFIDIRKVLAINFVDIPAGSKSDPDNFKVEFEGKIFQSRINQGELTLLTNGSDGQNFGYFTTFTVPVFVIDKDGNSTEVATRNFTEAAFSNPQTIELEGTQAATVDGDFTNFTADVAIRIFANPNISTDEIDFGSQLEGLLDFGDEDDITSAFVEAYTNNLYPFRFVGPGGTSRLINFAIGANAAVQIVVDSQLLAETTGNNLLAQAASLQQWGNSEDASITIVGSQNYSGGGTFNANVKVLFTDGTTVTGEEETFVRSGTVQAGSATFSDSDGDSFNDRIGFILENGDSELSVVYRDTFDAEIVTRTPDGVETAITDVADAFAAINAAPPPVVVVEGANPKNAINQFIADLKVVINTGLITEPETTVVKGKLATGSTATLFSNGQIIFDLTTPEGTTMTVFVDSSLEDEDALIFRTADGSDSTLTPNSAIKRINELEGATIRVEGESAPTANGFNADVSFRIRSAPATAATLSGFATSTATENAAGGVEFTLEDENDASFNVTVSATAQITYIRNSGAEDNYDPASLAVLISGDDDGLIDLGGTVSGSNFTATNVTVYQDIPETSGEGGAYVGGPLVGSATQSGNDLVFTVDFFDWQTGTNENVTVTVSDGANYFIIDDEGNFESATRAQALAALNDNPLLADTIGSGPFTPGSGVYTADVELVVIAQAGQFGPNAHDGLIVSQAQVNVNSDVEFQLETFDEFGNLFTIDVTIDVSEATVTFIDKFQVETTLTGAQNIATQINNNADAAFVSSIAGQTGADFIADDIVKLFENDIGGGFGSFLAGKMKTGTTASVDTSGNLNFTLDMDFPGVGAIDVAVTVAPTAMFEIADISGITSATASDVADALNSNPETSLALIEGNLPFDGESSYFADTHMTLEIFGQSTSLFGIKASNATVDGNDNVVFDVDTHDELGNPLTVTVTIDVGVATVKHYDSQGIPTDLTDAATIADLIDTDTMDVFADSTTVQSGGTFFADLLVELFSNSTGGGGFLNGALTPATDPSLDGFGDLTFSLDVEDFATGSTITVAVTVSQNATFDIIDFDGTEMLDVGVSAMLDRLDLDGDLGVIFLQGSLPWGGETTYFADSFMELSLIGGTGGTFDYWGTVVTDSPEIVANTIEFGIEVYEGAVEQGPVGPQIIAVTVTMDAFIESITPPGAPIEETDINTIFDLLDADPFEVCVGLTEQLDPGTSIYNVDANGHMTIFVTDPFGPYFAFGNIVTNTASFDGGPPETLTFEISDFGGPSTMVTVTEDASLFYVDLAVGANVEPFVGGLSAMETLLLQYDEVGQEAEIDVSGSSEPGVDTFTADIDLIVTYNSSTGGGGGTFFESGTWDDTFGLPTFVSGPPDTVTFRLTTGGGFFDVTVQDAPGTLLQYDEGAGPASFNSLDEVDDYIVNHPAALIIVESDTSPIGTDFDANVSILIDTLGGGGGPGFVYRGDIVTGTAAYDDVAETITFDLAVFEDEFGAPVGPQTITVTIDVSMLLPGYIQSFVGGGFFDETDPATIVGLLNETVPAPPEFIELALTAELDPLEDFYFVDLLGFMTIYVDDPNP